MVTRNSLAARPPLEFDKTIVKFSLPSAMLSSVIGTLMDFASISPLVQWRVPKLGVKSPGVVAVPATVS
jgi:hypothetical protein